MFVSGLALQAFPRLDDPLAPEPEAAKRRQQDDHDDSTHKLAHSELPSQKDDEDDA